LDSLTKLDQTFLAGDLESLAINIFKQHMVIAK